MDPVSLLLASKMAAQKTSYFSSPIYLGIIVDFKTTTNAANNIGLSDSTGRSSRRPHLRTWCGGCVRNNARMHTFRRMTDYLQRRILVGRFLPKSVSDIMPYAFHITFTLPFVHVLVKNSTREKYRFFFQDLNHYREYSVALVRCFF